MSVFKSSQHIYAQLIDDEKGATIVAVRDEEVKDKKKSVKSDLARLVGGEIAKKAGKTNTLVLTGKLTLRETICLLEKTSLTVSNSTGTIHLSAALGVPAVVIDSVRNVPGRWFPYGEEHQVLYHKFLSCDYREEICIKKSIETITVDEVFEGCDNILSRHEDKKAQSGFYR